MTQQQPQLRTVKQFASAYPAFSEGSLRWLIFKAGSPQTVSDDHSAALNDALVRIGRRVLIDENKFFEWARRGPQFQQSRADES
jgi:hypothetical protein